MTQKRDLTQDIIIKEKTRQKSFLIFAAVFVAMATLGAGSLLAQTSLWSDRNIYAGNYQPGDLVVVHVKENFSLKAKGKWGSTMEFELSVVPDKNNTPFLAPSEQSRVNSTKTKEDQNVSEKLEFQIAALLTDVEGQAGVLGIDARKQITLDGKVSSIVMTGFVDPGKIKKDAVYSGEIYNLTLSVTTAPPVFRDQTIEQEPATEDTQGDQFRWRDADKERLILNHIREIVGGLR